MAEVLSIPHQGEGVFGSSSLQRSSSHSSLLLPTSDIYHASPTNLKSGYSHLGYDNVPSSSLPSSAPSSPRMNHPQFSNQPSYTSTPSSSLSLDECFTDNEDINFPSYGDPLPTETSRASKSSKPTIKVQVPVGFQPKSAVPSQTASHGPTSRPQAGSASDDMDIEREPTRHVDYLSHTWKEEHIWCSWRHVVARRKVYSNSSRLENASWRTWAKTRYRLKTVSPDILNWYARSYPRELSVIG
ncbi:MAG: hypothetical protein Q9174_000892 [Haloplaca sp. 1 TL-2023]